MEHNNDLGKEFFNKKRYPALRTVAVIFIVYAVIIGINSIIMMYYFLDKVEGWFAFSALIGGGLLTLVFIAISESIKVLLDIEYNTRKALESIIYKMEKQKKNDNVILSEKIEEETSLMVKESDKVEKLNSLIKIQKGNVFGDENKDKIIELTMDLCERKEYAEDLLLYYKRNFNKDLLTELKSLSTSYDKIKSYLLPFIGLGIVKVEYPHDKI